MLKLRYDGAMEDMLVNKQKMRPVDWAVDVAIAAAAFAFGCLQLYLSVNLLIPDETLRRFLGIEALVPSANAIALAETSMAAARSMERSFFMDTSSQIINYISSAARSASKYRVPIRLFKQSWINNITIHCFLFSVNHADGFLSAFAFIFLPV